MPTEAVAQLTAELELDPYLTLPVATPDEIRAWLPAQETRRAMPNILRVYGRRHSGLAELADAHVTLVTRRPDWQSGLFCNLTVPGKSSYERLRDHHERLIKGLGAVDEYYAIDYREGGIDPHVHAVVWGTSLPPGDVEERWRAILRLPHSYLSADGSRLPSRAREHSAKVERVQGIGAIRYVAWRAVRHGDFEYRGPGWKRLLPAPAQVVGETLRDLGLATRRLGRPVRELIDAMSFLTWQLRNGPRPVEELRALMKTQRQEFSFATLLRAKAQLNVVSRRRGFGKGSRVSWAIE